MALIQCKDCNKEISDSAAACPSCGAPVPKTMGPDEGQCPHCMTIIHESAWVCSGCGAKKGYVHNQNSVYGKIATIIWGIVVPIIGTVIFPMAGIVLIPIMLFCVYRLFTGPVWYQVTSVNN
jgi:RNA polymerase subunit RPABC4/transcription elongation factor Spt4